MRVHLVRHACAGRKGDWSGSDESRPLDAVGHAQARDLARHLGSVPLRRLLTSPAVRCVETVADLAASHGIELERTSLLQADADPGTLLAALTDPALADAALCTHGETMKALLPLLRGAGTRVEADGADDDRLLLKGSVWTLTVDPGPRPTIVELRHVVPSAVESCADHPLRPVAEPVPHGS
jgi:8-oxo-dGTP diphosphatase